MKHASQALHVRSYCYSNEFISVPNDTRGKKISIKSKRIYLVMTYSTFRKTSETRRIAKDLYVTFTEIVAP